MTSLLNDDRPDLPSGSQQILLETQKLFSALLNNIINYFLLQDTTLRYLRPWAKVKMDTTPRKRPRMPSRALWRSASRILHPRPILVFFPSVLSILSLVVMTGISVYMANQVSHPPLRISSAQGGEGPARLRQFSASSSSHHVRETLRWSPLLFSWHFVWSGHPHQSIRTLQHQSPVRKQEGLRRGALCPMDQTAILPHYLGSWSWRNFRVCPSLYGEELPAKSQSIYSVG